MNEPRRDRTIETYRSPDECLTFLVVADADDVSLGFEGCPWHTHADLLAAYGFAGAGAVEEFLDALRSDRLLIAVLRKRGAIRDVWITDDPAEDRRRLHDGEDLEHRVWSGTRWSEA